MTSFASRSAPAFGGATALIAYAVTLVAFLAIDSVWLTTTSEILYRATLKDMLLDSFRVAPAILFYLVYIAALTWFAVRPALASGSPATSLFNGAFFGFAAYGTYDLTNQATLRNWSTTLTVADMIWGSLLSAVAATIAMVVTRRVRG